MFVIYAALAFYLFEHVKAKKKKIAPDEGLATAEAKRNAVAFNSALAFLSGLKPFQQKKPPELPQV